MWHKIFKVAKKIQGKVVFSIHAPITQFYSVEVNSITLFCVHIPETMLCILIEYIKHFEIINQESTLPRILIPQHRAHSSFPPVQIVTPISHIILHVFPYLISSSVYKQSLGPPSLYIRDVLVFLPGSDTLY